MTLPPAYSKGDCLVRGEFPLQQGCCLRSHATTWLDGCFPDDAVLKPVMWLPMIAFDMIAAPVPVLVLGGPASEAQPHCSDRRIQAYFACARLPVTDAIRGMGASNAMLGNEA